MTKILRAGRPSPAMIVAVIAVIAALAGTAVAGKSGLLTKKQFTNQAITGPITYVSVTTAVAAPNAPRTLTTKCPKGHDPIGGSARTTVPEWADTGFFVFQQYPTAGGWTAQVNVFGPGNVENVIVTAICVKAKKTKGALTGVTSE